jgi:hypothetical protein
LADGSSGPPVDENRWHPQHCDADDVGSRVKLRRDSRFSERPFGGERPVGGRRDCASLVVAEFRLGGWVRRCAKRVMPRVVQRRLGGLDDRKVTCARRPALPAWAFVRPTIGRRGEKWLSWTPWTPKVAVLDPWTPRIVAVLVPATDDQAGGAKNGCLGSPRFLSVPFGPDPFPVQQECRSQLSSINPVSNCRPAVSSRAQGRP